MVAAVSCGTHQGVVVVEAALVVVVVGAGALDHPPMSSKASCTSKAASVQRC